MTRLDAMGRRRTRDQERGLRPLYPQLPENWMSRAMRVSMPASGWRLFDALVAQATADTQTGARAVGQTLMSLMTSRAMTTPEVHWLDFEGQKAARLLGAVRAA